MKYSYSKSVNKEIKGPIEEKIEDQKEKSDSSFPYSKGIRITWNHNFIQSFLSSNNVEDEQMVALLDIYGDIFLKWKVYPATVNMVLKAKWRTIWPCLNLDTCMLNS